MKFLASVCVCWLTQVTHLGGRHMWVEGAFPTTLASARGQQIMVDLPWSFIFLEPGYSLSTWAKHLENKTYSDVLVAF